MTELKEQLVETARKLGSPVLGVVSPRTADRFAGIRVGWPSTRPTETAKVTDLMPGVSSVVVLGYAIWDSSLDMVLRRPGGENVYIRQLLQGQSVMAVHQVLTGRGHAVSFGGPSLSHKNLAVAAGLGALGKSSLLVNRAYGPSLRIAALLTDAELEPNEPAGEDLCGDCRACVDACPVGALEPYRVDPDRCLVGKALSGGGGDDRTVLSPHAYIMCRACQDACPYGRFRQDEPGWVS